MREFLILADQARRAPRLRARIIELLEAGAPVEPGALTAVVTRRAVRRLTKGKLTAVIGADVVKVFMENIELSESRRLDVREG